VTLRRNGRLRFEGVESLMICPGEITLARRPTLAHANAAIFRDYPMDFLRRVRAHAEMLEEAATQIHPKSSVLDLGCGIGLLTEHLPDLLAPVYYFAGPPGMTMAVQGMLEEIGVSEEGMRSEEFYGY